MRVFAAKSLQSKPSLVPGHDMQPLLWGYCNQTILMSCQCGLLVAEYRPEVTGNQERAMDAWNQHQREAREQREIALLEFRCESPS